MLLLLENTSAVASGHPGNCFLWITSRSGQKYTINRGCIVGYFRQGAEEYHLVEGDVLSSRSNIAGLLKPNSSEKLTQLLGKKFGTLDMG